MSRFQRYRDEILFTCNGAILHDDFNILGLRIKVEKLRVVFSRQGIIITALSYYTLNCSRKNQSYMTSVQQIDGKTFVCVFENHLQNNYKIYGCKRETQKNSSLISFLVVVNYHLRA